jgi:hypothetical protein
MQHVALFLLWKVQDYATYAASGRRYVLEMQTIPDSPGFSGKPSTH